MRAIVKMAKHAIRILTNSNYNDDTNPLLKSLKLLIIKDMFGVHYMELWYKFINSTVLMYFASMFR